MNLSQGLALYRNSATFPSSYFPGWYCFAGLSLFFSLMTGFRIFLFITACTILSHKENGSLGIHWQLCIFLSILLSSTVTPTNILIIIIVTIIMIIFIMITSTTTTTTNIIIIRLSLRYKMSQSASC